MYLVRTDAILSAGRGGEFEKWWGGLGPILTAQRGFQLSMLLNSLGQPARYTSVTRWEDRASARTYQQGEALRAHLAARTPGLFSLARPQEAYELVLRVGDPAVARASHVTLVEWTTSPGAAGAFEANRKELFELRQQNVPGFITNGLYRYLGSPDRYLIALAYSSQEAARAANTVPAVAAFQSAHPFSEFASTPRTIEAFEEVQRVQV